MRREPKLFSGKPVSPEPDAPEVHPQSEPVRVDAPAVRTPQLEPEFQSERRESRKRRRFPVTTILVLILLGGLAYAGWKGYAFLRNTPAASAEVPLFTADTAAFKTEPEDPGGMEVDNQGTLVLEETLTGEESDEFEVLLPEPEEPLEVDVVTSGDEVIDVAAVPVTNDPILSEDEVASLVESVMTEVENSVPSGLPIPVVKPEPPAQSSKALAEITALESDIVIEPSSGTGISFDDVAASLGSANDNASGVSEPMVSGGPVEEVDSTVFVPEGTGIARVQIAAYSSRAAADAAWGRLYRNHNDLLTNVDAMILEAVISGTSFFRLQVGAYDAKTDADALCASLKQRDVDCLVVGP